MKSLDSMLHAKTGRCDYYRQKIAEHTPPKSENDRRMIRVYQRFLNRDRSFLQNLNMLRLIEEMHRDVLADAPYTSAELFKSPAPLDVEAFRTLLDETAEDCPNRLSFG